MIYNDFSVSRIRNNLALFAQSAEKIQNPDNSEMIEAEIAMMSAVDAVKASVTVLRASDAMQQAIIDVLA